MSRHQQILSFASKHKKFYKVAGRGLIKTNNLDEKFKKMTLGTGAPAREKITEEMGGSIRHHNRPYQLKDTTTAPKVKPTSHFKPIQFKL